MFQVGGVARFARSHPTRILLISAGIFACESRPTTSDPARPPGTSSPVPNNTTKAPPLAPPDFAAPDGSGWGEVAGLKYLETLTGKGQPADRLPLIVVIHGMGDRPSLDKAPTLNFPARVVLPQAPGRYMQGFSWFEYRVGANHPKLLAEKIRFAAKRFAAVIDLLRRNRPTRGKPIVVGFSQGGMLSWALALHHAESISFAIPIAGALPDKLWPTSSDSDAPPIRALHGEADPIVPVQAARDLAAAAQRLGFDVQLQTFPNAQHEITDPMAVQIGRHLREAESRLER